MSTSLQEWIINIESLLEDGGILVILFMLSYILIPPFLALFFNRKDVKYIFGVTFVVSLSFFDWLFLVGWALFGDKPKRFEKYPRCIESKRIYE